jgi:2-aminobenzoylacetyl-CoA thioesterase
MTVKKFKPVKITKHFYQLGTPFFPTYLSIGDSAMLIEGGTGATASIIMEQISELGIDPVKIKYIVLTHTHPDHLGAVPHLRRKWKHIKLLGNPIASKMLNSEKGNNEFFKLDDFIAQRMKILKEISELPPKIHHPNFKIDTVLEEGSKLDLGAGIVWNILFTPGHSPCQIALHEATEETVVIGDSCGLHQPEMDVFWPNYFISLEQYCNSLRKIGGLHAKRYALSHYGVIEDSNEVFIKKALKATEDYHLEMLERVNYGEDSNEVALEKAQWVESFVIHMPFKLMELSSQLLINRSQKDAEKTDMFNI